MTTAEKEQKTETVTLNVPSHPKYLYVIRSALYPILIDAGFIKKEARKIILAVDEACSNIIKYAYEGAHTGTIGVEVRVSEDALLIQLIDTGRKPDVARIAPRKLDEVRPGGLGTHFMSAVFDTIEYDTKREQGTLLTMKKKRQAMMRSEVGQ